MSVHSVEAVDKLRERGFSAAVAWGPDAGPVPRCTPGGVRLTVCPAMRSGAVSCVGGSAARPVACGGRAGPLCARPEVGAVVFPVHGNAHRKAGAACTAAAMRERQYLGGE